MIFKWIFVSMSIHVLFWIKTNNPIVEYVISIYYGYIL